ncbi:MlaD family protein [Candidatus Cyanaurora vandensis]|uniref:MlaD family protein n=1 Tax=Candidatus Cyanaurora vandensis TaxID=2714958 RepID=UPI00257D0DDB|nr:MlaD family protein [Candidatus Cyanaurora vandensis]
MGLLIIVGIAVGVGLVLWVSNFRAGGDRYQFSVVFEDANGMSAGVPVRLRGVNIGQVIRVTPSIEKVIVEAVVDSPDVILPRQARYTVGQRGLIGETFLEILPTAEARTVQVSLQDFRTECQNQGPLSARVVCPGATLTGETPTRVLDLVRSLNTVANRINGGVLDDLQATVRAIGTTAERFGELTTDLRSTARTIDRTARDFNQVANSASRTLDQLGTAGTAVTKVSQEVNGVVRENRVRIARTLEDLSQISRDLSAVTPTLADPQFTKSLTRLAENAAESAANIRRLSDGLSDPATIDALRETLDSARSTFRNAEQISTDVDELTGDPQFRANLRRLVEGLGQLVSTAEKQAPQIRKVANDRP